MDCRGAHAPRNDDKLESKPVGCGKSLIYRINNRIRFVGWVLSDRKIIEILRAHAL